MCGPQHGPQNVKNCALSNKWVCKVASFPQVLVELCPSAPQREAPALPKASRKPESPPGARVCLTFNWRHFQFIHVQLGQG